MATRPASRRSGSKVGVLVIAGLFAAVFATAIGYAVWDNVFPPGSAVATMNLLASDARGLVDAGPGDRLRFRTDVETYPMSLKQLQSALRKCTLEISLTDPAGREERTRCALFNGNSVQGQSSSDGAWLEGMLNDCELAMKAKGQHTVRARVEWSSGVSPTAARLEIRRVPATAP